MSAIRDRAKRQFPMVLVTLLSIVQALALELLWAHVVATDYLYVFSWDTVLAWLQIVATFLGLVLVWVVYASIMMRFRWVPVTADSIYPFIIGIAEFVLIELLHPSKIGWWMIGMGAIFGMMVWTSHATMRRARRDPDNGAFFAQFEPATLRDFYGQIAVVLVMFAAGLFVGLTGNTGWVACLSIIAAGAVVGWQFYDATVFWRHSVAHIEEDGRGD
jgi:hypothetical protein